MNKKQKELVKRAQFTVVNAVRTGLLIRPDRCSDCGRKRKVAGHHDDYTKPLDVRWLCYPCHIGFHKWFLSTGCRTTSAERAKERVERRIVATRLKRLRVSKGRFAGWVAKQIGVGKVELHQLEHGRLPWADWLRKAYLKAIGEQP